MSFLSKSYPPPLNFCSFLGQITVHLQISLYRLRGSLICIWCVLYLYSVPMHKGSQKDGLLFKWPLMNHTPVSSFFTNAQHTVYKASWLVYLEWSSWENWNISYFRTPVGITYYRKFYVSSFVLTWNVRVNSCQFRVHIGEFCLDYKVHQGNL